MESTIICQWNIYNTLSPRLFDSKEAQLDYYCSHIITIIIFNTKLSLIKGHQHDVPHCREAVFMSDNAVIIPYANNAYKRF